LPELCPPDPHPERSTGAAGATAALISVCLGFFVIQLDVTIVNVALPSTQREIGGSLGALPWVIDTESPVNPARRLDPPGLLLGVAALAGLSRPGVPAAVLADGLLLTVVAMMGVGLGAIVRHTAGGIAALVGLIFLPSIVGVLPAPWGSGSASSPCLAPPARSPRCTRTRPCSLRPGHGWSCWPGPPPPWSPPPC
jgi:MFS family permease